jgi:hypothetical protein
MSPASNEILDFFLAPFCSQFCYFEMREFSSFLFIFPVFAQPGAIFGPDRRISKSDRTSFGDEFSFAKQYENSFPGASSFSESISKSVNFETTVSPTSTVSDNAGTTSSSQIVDKELERSLDEEIELELSYKNGFENPMPFFGEIIKV